MVMMTMIMITFATLSTERHTGKLLSSRASFCIATATNPLPVCRIGSRNNVPAKNHPSAQARIPYADLYHSSPTRTHILTHTHRMRIPTLPALVLHNCSTTQLRSVSVLYTGRRDIVAAIMLDVVHVRVITRTRQTIACW